ncbi:hypothetical protein QBC39DRAFT_359798 [Podospora conica]|nr:hypothetical protein QBC39DRAFT_359798 [Schizothecium conicum]
MTPSRLARPPLWTVTPGLLSRGMMVPLVVAMTVPWVAGMAVALAAARSARTERGVEKCMMICRARGRSVVRDGIRMSGGRDGRLDIYSNRSRH